MMDMYKFTIYPMKGFLSQSPGNSCSNRMQRYVFRAASLYVDNISQFATTCGSNLGCTSIGNNGAPPSRLRLSEVIYFWYCSHELTGKLKGRTENITFV